MKRKMGEKEEKIDRLHCIGETTAVRHIVNMNALVCLSHTVGLQKERHIFKFPQPHCRQHPTHEPPPMQPGRLGPAEADRRLQHHLLKLAQEPRDKVRAVTLR